MSYSIVLILYNGLAMFFTTLILGLAYAAFKEGA
jgi:hypothetical protein